MFIEEEADAVFNEIKKLKKDNDDGEEEEEEEEITTNAERNPAASPGRARAPLITMNVDVVSRAEQTSDIELEEPVSPPACHPSEGPPLLFSQSIEELAAVIVKENRKEEDKEDVAVKKKTVPALIPLTVSEFGERTPINSSPSTLHMSGGGVYTTDSYYRKIGPPITTSTTSIGSRLPPLLSPPQLSVIKKLPVSAATPLPAKKRTVIKSKTAPVAEDKEKKNILKQFYKKSSLISEAQKTIKLSDGLEITPIINVPTVGPTGPTVPTKKRSYESTDNDHNQGSKRAKNDLVIEKFQEKLQRKNKLNRARFKRMSKPLIVN